MTVGTLSKPIMGICLAFTPFFFLVGPHGHAIDGICGNGLPKIIQEKEKPKKSERLDVLVVDREGAPVSGKRVKVQFLEERFGTFKTFKGGLGKFGQLTMVRPNEFLSKFILDKFKSGNRIHIPPMTVSVDYLDKSLHFIGVKQIPGFFWGEREIVVVQVQEAELLCCGAVYGLSRKNGKQIIFPVAGAKIKVICGSPPITIEEEIGSIGIPETRSGDDGKFRVYGIQFRGRATIFAGNGIGWRGNWLIQEIPTRRNFRINITKEKIGFNNKKGFNGKLLFPKEKEGRKTLVRSISTKDGSRYSLFSGSFYHATDRGLTVFIKSGVGWIPFLYNIGPTVTYSCRVFPYNKEGGGRVIKLLPVFDLTRNESEGPFSYCKLVANEKNLNSKTSLFVGGVVEFSKLDKRIPSLKFKVNDFKWCIAK